MEIDSIALRNNGRKYVWQFNNGDLPWGYDSDHAGIFNPLVSGGIYSYTSEGSSFSFSPSMYPASRVVSNVNDTLVIRLRATLISGVNDSMTICLFWKRPRDNYAKADNPWSTVSFKVKYTGSWQDIRIPLNGPMVKKENGGWVTGDTLDRLRLDYKSPEVISCSYKGPSEYIGSTGTSMASPVVAGLAALILQKYNGFLQQNNTLYGKNLNIHDHPLWNSSVRGILIHTATDMVNNADANDPAANNPDFVSSGYQQCTIYGVGPDWATGWGLVNAVKALDYTVPNDRFFEGILAQGQTRVFKVQMPSGLPNARFTLCWDDPNQDITHDETNAYNKKLVNDLNIYARNVSTGRVVYPWTLSDNGMHGTTIPSNGVDPVTPDFIRNHPAVRGIDTLNNVEVIDIANPEAGQWEIVVSGRILQHQSYETTINGIFQDFSLIYDVKPGNLDYNLDYSSVYQITSGSPVNLSFLNRIFFRNSSQTSVESGAVFNATSGKEIVIRPNFIAKYGSSVVLKAN